jgi:segregation and condensation protein B
MTDFSLNTINFTLEAQLEALLFVAAGPVPVDQLAMVLEKKPEEVQDALQRLSEYYLHDRGIQIQWHAGKVQLTTAPVLAKVVEKFLGLEATARLSRAALESLAIIAYRQPITRPGIDFIRGVNSDGVLKSLLGKGLIQEIGRAEGPGRPILFGTTADFLQHFGLSSLDELPPYKLSDAETHAGNNTILKD